jgi:hypothetical protein
MLFLVACNPEKTYTVTGGAWYRDEVIRGLKLYVCKREAIDRFLSTQAEAQSRFDSKPKSQFQSSNQLDASLVSLELLEKTDKTLTDPALCIAKGTTDIDGKYSFTLTEKELKDGHAYLYSAGHRYSYTTRSDITGLEEKQSNYVHWIIEIPTASETARLDLSPDNELHFIDFLAGLAKTKPEL